MINSTINEWLPPYRELSSNWKLSGPGYKVSFVHKTAIRVPLRRHIGGSSAANRFVMTTLIKQIHIPLCEIMDSSVTQ